MAVFGPPKYPLVVLVSNTVEDHFDDGNFPTKLDMWKVFLRVSMPRVVVDLGILVRKKSFCNYAVIK
eukprot:5220265-Pyramimonas_sp.AAC.1